jgi:hypothetical protein
VCVGCWSSETITWLVRFELVSLAVGPLCPFGCDLQATETIGPHLIQIPPHVSESFRPRPVHAPVPVGTNRDEPGVVKDA